jgi:hypothetical protein
MKKIVTKDHSMKTSPVQHLESIIAARRKSQAEMSELGRLLADKTARRVTLETTGNLDDVSVITELGQLQVFVELLPRRVAAKEEDDVKAEKTLTQATNEFICLHLGPRVRQLATRTRAIVKTELSSHFRDPSDLIRAVAQSQRVRSIEALDWSVTFQPARGAIAHAEGALKAWVAVDDFEKTLSLENV